MILLAIFINTIAPLAKYNLAIYLILIFVVLTITKMIKLRTNRFSKGLIGEQEVDKELQNLKDDYLLIKNGLNTSKGNIDKIIVGPTGVWIIEVKSHKGNITFNDNLLLKNGKPFEKDFLKQAYAEAKTFEELLKAKLNLVINVQPVIVFSDKSANVKLGLKKYCGVFVIQKSWLKKLLTETLLQNIDTPTIRKIVNCVRQKNKLGFQPKKIC